MPFYTQEEILRVYTQLGLAENDCLDLKSNSFSGNDLQFYGLTKDCPIQLSGASVFS